MNFDLGCTTVFRFGQETKYFHYAVFTQPKLPVCVQFVGNSLVASLNFQNTRHYQQLSSAYLSTVELQLSG